MEVELGEDIIHESHYFVVAEVADGAFVSVVDILVGTEVTCLDVESYFLVCIAEGHTFGGESVDGFNGS